MMTEELLKKYACGKADKAENWLCAAIWRKTLT